MDGRRTMDDRRWTGEIVRRLSSLDLISFRFRPAKLCNQARFAESGFANYGHEASAPCTEGIEFVSQEPQLRIAANQRRGKPLQAAHRAGRLPGLHNFIGF